MKETEMKRVPKLRFPEFTDDWEQRKLGEVYNFQYGEFNNNPDNGGKYPVYGANGIIGGYTNFNAEDSSIIGHMGAYAGYVVWAAGKHFVTYNGTIAKPSDNSLDSKFGYYILSQKKIYRICAGSGQPFVSYADLNGIDVEIPKDKNEQVKIGTYFSNLDYLITLHQRKLEKLKELRKGVMKKLFSQEVRFKADDGSEFSEWEKKKIGDVFSKIKDKNKDGRNQNVITNSAEFGLINQRDFFDKDIAVDGKTENYTVIKTGDFVYNPRKSKQAPYGPFNCYKLEENGIVSPLYTCLRPKSNVNDKYLLWYFKSGSWYRFIYENGAQNGARHDRVGMTDSLMQEIPVYLPQAVEEQQKIAECLSALDDVIEKQKATLAAWEKLKKGLLQQMFV